MEGEAPLNLYLTADRINIQTGGGLVTHHESQALKTMNTMEDTFVVSIDHDNPPSDPFAQDQQILERVKSITRYRPDAPKLAHCYAGTLTETVKYLKELGTKIVYTAAAHDIDESRKAHESLGVAYNYPHMTDPDLLAKYLGGYLVADCIVCPSTHSMSVMRKLGYKGMITLIPHGCDLPESYHPITNNAFVVGYLGAIGPDKGLQYLLQAWKELNLPNTVLVLGGSQSKTGWMNHLLTRYGGSNIMQLGWVDDLSFFYNNINLYIQPSVTEGFGIEVLEAMSYNRPVICSTGAGACDLVPSIFCYTYSDVERLKDQIKRVKDGTLFKMGNYWRDVAEGHIWDKIRARYQDLWRSILKRGK